MDDDQAALQARIAALAGTINKHKQSPSFARPPTHVAPHHTIQHHRVNNRWGPYGRGGARGGAAHKNRTLVLAGAQPSPGSRDQDAFISARGGRVHQLLTKETFAREQKQRAGLKEQPNAAHNTQVVPLPSRMLQIEGLQFQMQEDGRKLLRLPDQLSETPRKCMVAGVEFLRTKHGNLTRASDQDKKQSPTPSRPKPPCENFTRYGTLNHPDSHTGYARRRFFGSHRMTLAGNCPFGPGCRFAHTPSEVAICKEFLRRGSCSAGQNCNLSHEPTYHRVPACTHFLRGNCTNSACRYPHVNVSPATRVCRPFATLGYCPKGPECDSRHVVECPDYSNHGRCARREQGSCQLPHIDHAATLRKIARRQAKNGAEDESDLSSSDEEEAMAERYEEVDSDVAEEEDAVMNSADHSHALSQQSDFVSFS